MKVCVYTCGRCNDKIYLVEEDTSKSCMCKAIHIKNYKLGIVLTKREFVQVKTHWVKLEQLK